MADRQGRVVLALGAYTLDREGAAIRRGREGVEAAARQSFADEPVRIVSIADFDDFEDFFEPTVETAGAKGLMPLAGAASGQFIQEALEGDRVTDIHVDLTGIEDALEQSQAASELRNLIAHLRSAPSRTVTIHFRYADGLSTIPGNRDVVLGAPLPVMLRKHLTDDLFPDEPAVAD